MTNPISHTRRLFRTLYLFDLEAISDAYRSARAKADTEAGALSELLEKLRADVAAGLVPADYRDQDGQILREAGDNIIYDLDSLRQAQGLIREAFTIVLHHFWERTVTTRLGEARYDEARDLSRLVEIGFTPDAGGLKLLRLAANVAKHSAGKSAQQLFALQPEMFDPSVASADDADYHALRLSDQHVAGFFASLKRSAPL